ncbi:MAG: hypothetical protein R6V10_11140, partial [bacterium]
GHPGFRLRQHPDLAMLVFACVYFAAVWLERKAKLKILATHVFKAAKRLFGIPACAQRAGKPDFHYYAVSDGIKSILQCAGQGPIHPRGLDPPPHPQLKLFDT